MPSCVAVEYKYQITFILLASSTFTFLVDPFICAIMNLRTEQTYRVPPHVRLSFTSGNHCSNKHRSNQTNVCFQQSASNVPAAKHSRVTPAGGNTEESSPCNATKDSNAARRRNSSVRCVTRNSSISTVCWGITMFTRSRRVNSRKILLDKRDDKKP